MDVIIRRAARKDIPQVAGVFAACFKDTIIHLFGRMPGSRRVFRDMFVLCLSAEPGGFLVAEHDGRITGYIFTPSDMRRVWRTAVRGGHLLRWIGRWVRREYGFGWHPLRFLLLDKFAFLRESLRRELAAEARVLSIGVLPGARGSGTGTMLLRAGMDYLFGQGVTRIRLEVRPGNLPAVRMYEGQGFRAVGRMEDSQGQWMIMMYDREDGS